MLKDIIFMIETTMSFPVKYLTIRTLSLIPKINSVIVNHSVYLGNRGWVYNVNKWIEVVYCKHFEKVVLAKRKSAYLFGKILKPKILGSKTCGGSEGIIPG